MSTSPPANLWDAFSRTVRAHGPRTAFISGGSCVTFEQWMARAQDYAMWFAGAASGGASGGGGERALVIMRNSPEMAAAMCGIWGAGGIPALLHADSPPSHVAHAIELINPRCVFVDDGSLVRLPDIRAATPSDIARVRDGAARPIDNSPARLGDPASIVFTSGSTGPPKGVIQSHGNLLRGCRAVNGYLGLDHGDSIVCPIPWSFDYGFGLLLTTMIMGARQILPDSSHPAALCEAIARHRPTMLPGVPSLFAYLFTGLSPVRETDLSSLRIVSSTGGAIAPSVFDGMLDAFGHCRIFLNYGLTESYRTSALDPALVRAHPTSVGRAIPGVSIAIVREDRSEAAPGEEGEIVHRGDFIFLSYYGDPAATSRVRRPDPRAAPAPTPTPGTGAAPPALFTGDYGRIDADGLLFIHGRRDRQLKSMGVRISPEEIERLLQQSGLVQDAAVFGQKHDMLGDEVCAAVVPAPGATDIASALARFARATMSPAMVPRRWLIRAALPRTSTGKTDYPALRGEAARRPAVSSSPEAPAPL